MLRSKTTGKRISRPIIRISIIGISLGLIVMILAVSIITGFQSQIRDKVIGFGSHIQINSFASNISYESVPVLINQEFYPHLDTVDGVRHIQVFATKPGIIQTDDEIQGIVAKGVGEDFDWGFFADKMKKGKVLSFHPSERNDTVMISTYMSKKLLLDMGDTLTTYFLHQELKPRVRRFIIGGIYETGLEDFDRTLMIVDIRHIQRLQDWGVRTVLFAGLIDSSDVILPGIGVEARATGMYGNFEYEWVGHPEWEGPGPHPIMPTSDTSFQLIVTDLYIRDVVEKTLPDTAWLEIKFNAPIPADGIFGEDDFDTYLETSGGSGKYYAGGFEVMLNEYDDLLKMDDIIYHKMIGNQFDTTTILDQFPEIFGWLEMIDVNVELIIWLMIIVAVINMTSALLVLILEKTTMIGVLKAMGHSNWSIRKVFLYNAAYLIGKGLLWGNVIGITLCWIQYQFGVISLPQDSYYISTVPISFNLWHILLLNAGTIVVCMWALLAPTYLITRITPVKAIRFN